MHRSSDARENSLLAGLLRQTLALTLRIGLVVAAIVVAGRCLSGAARQPLGSIALLSAGFAAIACAAAVRALEGVPAGGRPRERFIGDAVLSVALVLLTAGLHAASASAGAAVLLWSAIIASEAAVWWQSAQTAAAAAPDLGNVVPIPLDAEEEPDIELPAAEAVDENVTQHLVRTVLPGGGERIDGLLRLALVVGQRVGHLHVSFCPPLAMPPEVMAVQAEGPSARVRVVQTFAYGARVEVKLDAPAAEPTGVVVVLKAETPPIAKS